MRCFDVHTHLLPEIDDGASNIEQTKQMIYMLKEQGITDVVLTPHFYHFRTSIDEFKLKRQYSLKISERVFVESGLNVYVGAEVYLVDTIFSYADISSLCINESPYILIELPFDNLPVQKIISMLYKLCANYSVKPIIAHIERYPLYFNEAFLWELKKIDCLVQFDVDCLNNFFIRQKIKKYLKKTLVHLAGSDCHDSEKRRPNFDLLKKYLPIKLVDYVFYNSNLPF